MVRGPPDPAHPDLPGPVILLIGTPQNLDTLRTAGVDIDVRYRVAPSSVGRLTLSLNGTYVAKYETSGMSDVFPVSAGRAAAAGGAISRWRHFLAVPMTLDGPPWFELPVGVLVVASSAPEGSSSLRTQRPTVDAQLAEWIERQRA